MNENDSNRIANQFINLWQENLAKALTDPQIISQMTQAMGNMQQFYDKSSTTTSATSHESGSGELHWGELTRRIDELENRIRELESAKRSNKKPSKK